MGLFVVVINGVNNGSDDCCTNDEIDDVEGCSVAEKGCVCTFG